MPTKMNAEVSVISWECPNCGAAYNKCGRIKGVKPRNGFRVDDLDHVQGSCEGLICECEFDTTEEHGTVHSDPCKTANCYHCGWGGTMPPRPKNLKPWERKAIDAGWSPPKGWNA